MNLLFNARGCNVAGCIHSRNDFHCHNNLLWDMASNLSGAMLRGGWIQLVSYQSLPPPRGCSHQCKGDSSIPRAAGVLGSEEPSWVLLAGLLPIRMSGHGWRFINSVLLLEFLCCANLLLSDHFQQIYVASHVKLRKTLTNQGKPFIKLPNETIHCFYKSFKYKWLFMDSSEKQGKPQEICP